MKTPESIEREIVEAINRMLSPDETTLSGEEILKEQVEQILKKAGKNERVVVLKERGSYGVYLLDPDVDLAPFYLEETGRSYFFPRKSCPFCRYCGDLLWDYTNGPYCFFCEIGLDDPDYGGMEGTCREFTPEERK